jgi:hypothetical protein
LEIAQCALVLAESGPTTGGLDAAGQGVLSTLRAEEVELMS